MQPNCSELSRTGVQVASLPPKHRLPTSRAVSGCCLPHPLLFHLPERLLSVSQQVKTCYFSGQSRVTKHAGMAVDGPKFGWESRASLLGSGTPAKQRILACCRLTSFTLIQKKITSLEVSQWHGVSNDKHSHSNGRGDEYNATETFTSISSSSAQLWFKARAGRTLQTKICLCGHARTKCVPSLQAGGHWYRAGELLESCGRWSELAPRLQREQCWCLPAYLVSVRVMDVIRGVGRCCRGVSFPLD